MKCMLIIPSWSEKDLFPDKLATSARHLWQPLGVLYVGAALLRHGHDVQFNDGALHTHQYILKKVIAEEPQWVGIYSNMPIWNAAKRVIRDIKVMRPGRSEERRVGKECRS